MAKTNSRTIKVDPEFNRLVRKLAKENGEKITEITRDIAKMMKNHHGKKISLIKEIEF